MTGRTASRPLRKAVCWSIGVRVAGVLLLALCAAAGIRVGSTARLALELATTVPLVFLVTRTATACSRYRRGGLTWRAALYAVAADVVSVPALRLALDLWGVFFILGLFASFVVRPHVIGADGSLRLRSGALLDIRIPAQDIAAVRAERRTARGKKGTVDDDEGVNLSVGGQTTVTVELARPVTFTRPLGKQARARVFRFYAADPATAVAALRARVPEPQNVP
jgi:hypothetical protein